MLDALDRKIVSILQYDGRIPYTTIAEKLDVTEGAVRRRVKRMIETGKLQIVAIAEPDELGLSERGMIGINVEGSQIDEVGERIAQLPEVSYLFQAAGEFDMFAEVFCQDRDHFVSFLNQKLQKIPGVLKTQSFLILKMHKLSYRWGEAHPPETDLRSKKVS